MNLGRLILRQVRYENRDFWRSPESAFFYFAFPLVFMLTMNLVFSAAFADEEGDLMGFYTPAYVVFGVIMATFTSLAMTVAIARDEGLLKRIHGSPMPTWAYLSARVLFSILMALVLALIMAAFGAVLFGVGLPIGSIPMAVVVVALGAACFTALGLAVGGLVPSAQSAPVLVNGVILPLLFISNVFIEIEDGILVTISNLFPVRHFADALQAVYHPDVAGPLDLVDLVWLAGWGLAALLVARMTFSWEPPL
jgi:ABC-2 type transport system permease protein